MTQISSYENKPLLTARKMTSPGDYEFKSCRIAGKEFIDKLVSITLFEDMTKPYITGELVCIDTQNVPSSLPLIGGEKIEFSVSDCFRDTEDFVFYVTKVADRTPISLGSLSYVIHFSSGIGILTAMRKVSKAYQRTKPEDIISDLLTNYLSIPGETLELDFSPTSNLLSCVVPNWRPAHAVKWIASRSIASRQDHSYSPYTVFQERNSKLTMAPLDFFYDESTNITKGEMTIKHSRPTIPGQLPSLQSDPRMPSHLLAFESFNIVKTTDYIENLMNGMYSNEVSQINLFARAFEENEYSYLHEFSNSKHMNEFPFVRENMLGFDEASHWRSVASHDGLFSDMDPSAKINDYVHMHLAKWQETEQHVVQGVVPGHFGLRVGQKYEINIPAFKDVSRQTQQIFDEYYSGKYLVESIKHEFSADRHYYATLQMWTDSVSKKIEPIR
ncbi:tail protein [Sinorhizobium phage phiM9]|uniref:Uncharacterized protein n=1 Tax=Sinorhizobium phage phiM9 TaxID=1636182 RepID=A0A0F6R5X8_9CAUD|nr:tail protein [Sinorhizobium phage phiM9]AKE44750.1 hypothetical protein Sm_phiM9_122 [Sinorhizobium phage phiM9]